MENACAIAAALDLTDDRQRAVCELVRRFHSGRWSIFVRMHNVQLVGDALVELAEWRGGGFAVVRWSLTELGLRWQECSNLIEARQAFAACRQP